MEGSDEEKEKIQKDMKEGERSRTKGYKLKSYEIEPNHQNMSAIYEP